MYFLFTFHHSGDSWLIIHVINSMFVLLNLGSRRRMPPGDMFALRSVATAQKLRALPLIS